MLGDNTVSRGGTLAANELVTLTGDALADDGVVTLQWCGHLEC